MRRREIAGSRARGNPRLRWLDRTVGVPVVAAAGLLRRKRPLPADPRRIGVLNSTNIGDTVLLSPVLRDLAAAFPSADVILFVQRAALPLARLVDGVRPVEISIAEPRSAIRSIRRERPDVVLDFDPWPRIEAVYSLLSGARYAVGFRTPGQHRHYCDDAVVDHSADVHELENFRRLAGAVGVESSSLPVFSPPAVEPPVEPPYVVLHLWPSGYRSTLKEWPQERWRALARELAGRGRRILLTGSPADEARSREFAGSLPDLGDAVVDVSGRYALDELLGVLAASECVVAVNTGVMHMAAAVGAPTVALNGPTAARRWGPVGPRAVSVDSSLDGCGYLNLGWEYRGRRTDCMHGIESERVLEAVLGMLDGPRLR